MKMKRILILLAALCLLLTLPCAQALAEKPGAIELPPLPDVDITSWEFLYAGPHLGVGRYHPHVANVENQYMDERCAEATIDFLNAAREQGFEVYMCTAYRNWEYTTFWYEEEMRKYGKFDDEYCHFLPGASYEAAKHGFAAGCSEHSTGLAFDITDESIYWADMNYSNVHDETVADTPVCKWMDKHCAAWPATPGTTAMSARRPHSTSWTTTSAWRSFLPSTERRSAASTMSTNTL